MNAAGAGRAFAGRKNNVFLTQGTNFPIRNGKVVKPN